MIKLLDVLQVLIIEGQQRLLKRFTLDDNRIIDVEYNHHATIGQNNVSNLSRTPFDQILESMDEVLDVIYQQASHILKGCYGKKCSLIIRDNAAGFDCHFWLRQGSEGKIITTINTSIQHPQKLFNKNHSRIIVIDWDGSYDIMESFAHIKINDKIVQYYLFD